MRSGWFITLSTAVLVSLLMTSSSHAQHTGASAGDWPSFRHDQAGTGYSPLSEINTKNVATLTEAWTYSLKSEAPPSPGASGRGGAGGAGGLASEATPIVVGGVMYLPAADRIVALDPGSGRVIWNSPVTGGVPSRRGVVYWPGDDTTAARIFFVAGRRLVALSAKTGAVEQAFGTHGEVDMVMPYNSVPLVYRNNVVVGANSPPGGATGVGNPRAFDARTGVKVWEFSSVPQPGEVGHDTWEGESWKNRGGVNAWPFYFTMDEARGLLFVPLAAPVVAAYGGDRKGANLFGNSLVAIDVLTGKYKWHFQTIHHDLWDAEPAAAPSLFDVVQNGRTIPALALTTKSGYLYILNRETGQPLFGVEERPVPKSDVPGEATFPTQPFPLKPPPIARVRYTAEDLVTAADTTPEHVKACAELIERNGGVFNAGPFTPWGYRPEGASVKSTLVFPNSGASWGGTTFDNDSGLVVFSTQDLGALGWMEKAKEGSPVPFAKASLDRTFDVRMSGTSWPCQKPPWGRLMAVKASTGDVMWQVPLGITEQLPAEKQRTGRPLVAGPIITAGGVVFIGATDDNRFRALDVKTGAELWATRLARRGNADPMTFEGGNGKQYVAIVATDTLVVYTLP